MRKLFLSAAVCVATVGVALAQVEASSSTYLLDIDPARYSGPMGQRLELRVGDQPRHVTIGAQDEVCVQLQRVAGETEIISARVRALRPEPMTAEIRLIAPDISPGTFRSTPWGMLLRAVPQKSQAMAVKTVAANEAPVCTFDETPVVTRISDAARR
jgi:hypothetical protein